MRDPSERPSRPATSRSAGDAGVYLGLGTNLGDREEHLRRALAGLAGVGLTPVASSAIYRTEPVGGPPQGSFLNLVLRVATSLAPTVALEACSRVEAAAGRRRTERWGPRTLDIDLLLFGDRIIRTPRLEIPHPRLHLRRFVLVPLAELAPGAVHPVLQHEIRDLLAACPDRSAVTRHAPPPLPGG